MDAGLKSNMMFTLVNAIEHFPGRKYFIFVI